MVVDRHRASYAYKIHVYTPNEQETVVTRLHHYETIGGVECVSVRRFVTPKDVYHVRVRCNDVPAVFRVPIGGSEETGNWEMYVVCTGYLGRVLASPFVRKFFATDERTRDSIGVRDWTQRN